MLVPDDKPATVRTAEHYRQYRQQLAKKGVTKKPHAISTKNNIKGIKLRWKKCKEVLQGVMHFKNHAVSVHNCFLFARSSFD
jgi:hypothetical protein